MIPPWAYDDMMEAAKGWSCCVCGGPLPEPCYTMTCKRCKDKEVPDAR